MLPPIKHEPTSQTGLSHVDGAISMARNAPGTASGDFFITSHGGHIFKQHLCPREQHEPDFVAVAERQASRRQPVPAFGLCGSRDDQALHVLGWLDDLPVGTARVFIEGDTGKIGRVCVLASARGTGLGAALMRAAVDEFRRIPGVKQVKLGAQTHALGFYERLGFAAFGPEYMDAGIPHRDMVLAL